MSVRRSRAAALVGAGLGCAVLAATMTAATAEAPRPSFAATGSPAPSDHRHEPDHDVLVVRGGFAPYEAVRSRLLSSADRSNLVRADGHGSVRVWVRPRPGRHGDVLTLVGLGAPAPATSMAGTITATVPRFAVVRFAAD